jgi:hypothetical protein
VDTKRPHRLEFSKAARFFEEGYVTGRTVLIVACLNREVPYFQGARGKGIAVLSFNEATGELTKFSEETNADNPNYLAIHEGNRRIYTVSDALGRKEGVVTAYQLDLATAARKPRKTPLFAALPRVRIVRVRNTLGATVMQQVVPASPQTCVASSAMPGGELDVGQRRWPM